MAAILHEPGGAVFLIELARAWPALLIIVALIVLLIAARPRV